jgi:hypothetical protein
MTKNNNLIEEEFEEICETIGHEILYTYDSLEIAEDSANTVKNMLKQFLEKAQLKAREELKKEIVEMITTYWQKQGDMIWPTDLVDKIKNI